MHFSIPDASQVVDDSGTPYHVFNVHINGVYHCSMRYKLCHSFNEQLKKEFGTPGLPNFPPKKLLSLNSAQLEERRGHLERYIQLISQNPQISTSPLFNDFLLQAQQHSQKEIPEDVSLDVFLMNGHKIAVNIVSTDQTDDVLEMVASQVDLPEEFVYYFGLWLLVKDGQAENTIVRKLQEFESPFISLKAANKHGQHRIVLRKSFWDPSLDDDLIEDRIAMNLVYVQAQSDIERGWVLSTEKQRAQLDALQQRNSKKEYLRYARTLKYYGYIQFKPCVCDYPDSNSRVIISTGNRELNFRVHIAKHSIKEVSFKVTRMRCWRITSVYPESDGNDQQNHSSYSRLELSFEYLMCKDTLQWITVTSDQAILMSMCLQGMVDELILKKQGKRLKRPQDREGGRRRNLSGSSSTTGRLSSTSSGKLNNNPELHQKTTPKSPDKTTDSKKFAIHHQVSSSTSSPFNRSVSAFSTSSYAAGGALTENEAFSREDGIGDDDL